MQERAWHAFVLMENHYHLMIELTSPNLSSAIQWIQWLNVVGNDDMNSCVVYDQNSHRDAGSVMGCTQKKEDKKS